MKSNLYSILGNFIAITNYLIYIIGIYLVTSWIFGTVPIGNTQKEYGFLHGISHGIQWTFNFLFQLFSNEVSLYAKHNSGLNYWLGYILGLLVLMPFNLVFLSSIISSFANEKNH
jgi:hypothetical protein